MKELEQDFSLHLGPHGPGRDEISGEDSVLHIREELIVPPALGKEPLTKIHGSHPDTEKYKQRARYILFQPGLSAQITVMRACCDIIAA